MASDAVHTPTPAPETGDCEPTNVLDTVEGEIHFFRALMRARPVGINRHFHVLTMKEAIEKGTKTTVSVEDIWRKLESCYNLDALEALEAEYEQNASSSGSSTPQPTESPKEGDNLNTHPFFRAEYSLPPDPFIDSLVAERRVRATASPMSTSSPAAAARSPSEAPARRGRKRKASAAPVVAVEPSKADLAGLVSGDSDSSDLTQQSGDEVEGSTGQPQTPSERRATSVVSGTDGGTDGAEEEEEEKGEDEAPRPKRGRKPGRGRGRGTRKRKR